MSALTWQDLVHEEPTLANLENEIKMVKPNGPHFCANDVWYGFSTKYRPGFKTRMSSLVGWRARNQNLNTKDAYDLAYQYLYHLLPVYHLLPGCRDCMCS